MIKYLLISMRPKQWYKNSLIFIGLVFSFNLFNQAMWVKSIVAFLVFCLLSSGIYLLNDILDIEQDKQHPIKKNRPIASGKLKWYVALIFSPVFICVSFIGAYWVNIHFVMICGVFYALNLCYSFGLKKVVLVDVLIIATDFTIRAIAGCLAIGVVVSPWIVACAFLLALVLVFSKRRHEVILLEKRAYEHRAVLKDYPRELCDQIISISSGALIVSYSLYTFHTDNLWMMITIPVVVYGLFRYLWLVKVNNMGGEPEKALLDKGILASVFIWAGLSIGVLYA